MQMPRRISIVLLSIFAGLAAHKLAFAQSAANVLLVINESSSESIEIGNYYVEKRQVPRENVVRLRINVGETIERADYERQIESPLANWFVRNFAEDHILYIVLTKGIPLRIAGSSGQD